MASPKLEVIQALRGVAALMVVLLHFKDLIAPVAPGLAAAFEHGYIGVDIFFLISGFIIYLSTAAPDARDARSFLLRRFCRVVLPAWVAMLLAIAVQPPYLRDLVRGVFFIPLSNTAPPFFGYNFLIVAWTLSYELLFYLVFAGALAFAAGRRHRGLVASVALVLLMVAAQAPACCVLDAERSPLSTLQLGFFPPQLLSLTANAMLLAFVVGIGLAWVYSQAWFTRAARWLLLTAPLGLALLLTAGVEPGHGPTRAGPLALVIVVYALAWQAWRDARGVDTVPARQPAIASAAAWRIAVYLGEVSYSLYLVHPSVKLGLAKAEKALGWQAEPWVGFALACCATLLLAQLFYRWVEMPAQRLGRYWSARRATAHAPLLRA